MADKKHTPEAEQGDPWWKQIGFAMLSFAFAGFFYWFLTGVEHSGRSYRAAWWFALLYNYGGKWVIIVPFALFGVVLLYTGIELLVLGPRRPASGRQDTDPDEKSGA